MTSRIVFRLRLSLALLTVFALVVGAAALIGRSVYAPLAVVQITELEADRLSYGIVDLDRGLFSRHSIMAPGYAGSRFDADPALVLQAAYRDGFADWTLSRLDVSSGALIPQMTLTTDAGIRLGITNFRQHQAAGGMEFAVHVRQSGEVYRSGGERDPDARLVTTVEPDESAFPSPVQDVIWSPGWTQLAVPHTDSVMLVNADGSDPVVIDVPTGFSMIPRWSLDSRAIVFVPSPSPPARSVPLPVVDAQTGEVLTELFGRGPNWCSGHQIVYSQIGTTRIAEVRLADPFAGTDEVILTRDMSDVRLPSERTFGVLPVEPDSCDAFIIATSDGYALLRRETRTLIPLGVPMVTRVNNEMRTFDVVGGDVLFQAQMDDGVQIRRVVLDSAVQHYDVLAEFDQLSATHMWLDGWRRGLFIDGGRLTLIDAVHRTQTGLTGPLARAFYVMP